MDGKANSHKSRQIFGKMNERIDDCSLKRATVSWFCCCAFEMCIHANQKKEEENENNEKNLHTVLSSCIIEYGTIRLFNQITVRLAGQLKKSLCNEMFDLSRCFALVFIGRQHTTHIVYICNKARYKKSDRLSTKFKWFQNEVALSACDEMRRNSRKKRRRKNRAHKK